MEKLTIEQKAKRYDEAIEKAKDYYNKGRVPGFCNYITSDIFPELKEKTDEEMIQKLIAVVHLYYGEGVDAERDECLEWLEKQGKNKPIERKEFTSIPFGAFDSELFEEMITIPDGCVATIEGNRIHIKKEGKSALEAIKEEKIDNANKPKFHEGDTIVEKDFFECDYEVIKEIKDGKYIFTDGSTLNIGEQDGWLLVKSPTAIEQNLAKKYGITGIGSKHAEGKLGEMIKKKTETENVDNTNNIEPKFHQGEWVVNKLGDSWYIDSFDKKNYQVSDGKGNHNYLPISKQDEMHIWTIEDAKDGDVLYYKTKSGTEYIVMNKGLNEYGNINSYFRYNSLDGFGVDIPAVLSARLDDITPATKEQRDILFQKMEEACYEWDSEKKS